MMSSLEMWWDIEVRRSHNALVQRIIGPINYMSPVIGAMTRHEGYNWDKVRERVYELMIPIKTDTLEKTV